METAFVSRHAFEEQFNTFHARGYGAEPSGRGLVGDADAIAANAGDSVFDANAAKRRKVRGEILSARAASDASVADYGAWAPARDGSNKPLSLGDLSAEQMEYVKWHAARREANLRARGKLKDEDGNVLPPIGGGSADAGASGGDDADFDAGGGEGRTEKSVFHGDSERNYAGESWIKPPKDRKRENDHCYVPKRCIHTWSGHAKGTQAIRFFPRHGHLLLSAGLDSKVKIWDVHGHGKCMRTYMGHEKALKDIQFTNDGTRFVSTSWDKKIKLWDTETGKVITSWGREKSRVLRDAPPRRRQTERLHGRAERQEDPAVRLQHRRRRAGVRPAPGRGELGDVLRRGAEIRVELGRQVASRVGIRHPGDDEVHRRPGDALDARGRAVAERELARVPEPGQSDRRVQHEG